MPSIRRFAEIPQIVLPATFETSAGSFFAGIYEKHGPIFRVANSGGEEAIYLVGPEANRFVLSSHRSKFSHREGWNRMDRVSELFGDGILFSDGAAHDEPRRCMSPAFATGHMDRYLALMNGMVRDFLESFAGLGEIDIYARAQKLTFDIAAWALLGLPRGAEMDRLRQLFEHLLTQDLRGSEVDRNAERRAIDEMTAILTPVVASERRCPSANALGMLLTGKSDGSWSDTEMLAQARILLLAGHATTSAFCAWLVYALTQRTEYAGRVLDEQLALHGPDGDVTMDSLDSMPLLTNAVLETERLFPPVPLMPRGAIEDFEFGGYLVPAGSYVVCSISGSHMIPSVFSNPARFDPDRFAPGREEQLKTPYALVGFGGGPRGCLGIHFAKMELGIIVSHFIRKFRFVLSPGQRITQLYHRISLPYGGIKLKLSPRG
ncbi:MAG: retinoid hydroxylase [Chthoniobacter sp.]|jgi:cytochrome P450|nr:retinoid hydroxylase [Chthoniobacter sp.]